MAAYVIFIRERTREHRLKRAGYRAAIVEGV
jgi:hypothetical protein